MARRRPVCVNGTRCGDTCISSKLICRSVVSRQTSVNLVNSALSFRHKQTSVNLVEHYELSSVDNSNGSLDYYKLDRLIVDSDKLKASVSSKYSQLYEDVSIAIAKLKDTKGTDSELQDRQALDLKQDELTELYQIRKAADLVPLRYMEAHRQSLLHNSKVTKAQATKMVDELVKLGGLKVSANNAASVRENLIEFHMLTNGVVQYKLGRITSESDRAYAKPDSYMVDVGKQADKATIFHELGHLAEDEDFRRTGNNWLVSRASKSNKLTKLSKITQQQSYGDAELAVAADRDKPFVMPYVGKYYGTESEYSSKSPGWDNRPTEVLSVGLEHFSSATDMLKLYKADREHFRMVEDFLV